MPGGYGTSGPWGSAGTSYVTPGKSSSPYQSGAGSTNQGGSNAVAEAANSPSGISESTGQTLEEALATNQPSDPNAYKTWEELAALSSMDPKYAKSFYGQQLQNVYGIKPGTEEWANAFSHHLGKFVATDSSGNPILDSSGNYILTGLGKHIKDQGQGSGINLENLQGIEKEYHVKRQTEMAQQTGGNQGYGYGYGHGLGGSGGVGGSIAGVHPRSFYKGLQYQDFSGKEVQKMLHFGQKIDAANVLSGLSQGAQAFAMDPKARGIMAVLTA